MTHRGRDLEKQVGFRLGVGAQYDVHPELTTSFGGRSATYKGRSNVGPVLTAEYVSAKNWSAYADFRSSTVRSIDAPSAMQVRQHGVFVGTRYRF